MPFPEKVLLIMHNLSAMRPEFAKTAGELAQALQRAVDIVLAALGKHEAEGYVKSYADQSGNKRFYLTEVGIIKVSALFT